MACATCNTNSDLSVEGCAVELEHNLPAEPAAAADKLDAPPFEEADDEEVDDTPTEDEGFHGMDDLAQSNFLQAVSLVSGNLSAAIVTAMMNRGLAADAALDKVEDLCDEITSAATAIAWSSVDAAWNS